MDGVKPVEYNLNQQVVASSEVGTTKVQEEPREKQSTSAAKILPGTKKEKLEDEDSSGEIEIQNVVAKLNDAMKFFRAKITFSYDPRINRSVIIVIDSETGEVIRQIPPEEMIMLISKLQELAGLLFNRKV